jgi:prephenate dehydrogenase
VFGAVMRHQDAPGTTFKRHMAIARGLMSEDDYLLTEIMFNPHSPHQLQLIQEQLAELSDIVKNRDTERMHAFINRVRDNIK